MAATLRCLALSVVLVLPVAATNAQDRQPELYTRGMKIAPSDARLYRHRGHRYISVRRFRDAIRDLERGRKLDPLSYDIAYHLGLARYMSGDFTAAAREYGRCFALAKDPKALAIDTATRRGFKSCTTIATDDDDRIAMGDTTRALSMFEQVARVPCWPAFGVIGSEVEMKRMRRR